MKRDPSEKKIYFGNEVERTVAFGLPTIFFVGIFNLEEIEKAVTNKEQQIYLAANQSFGQWVAHRTRHELAFLIASVLAMYPTKYVTIEVPASQLNLFMSNLAVYPVALDSSKLIIKVVAATPKADRIKNLYFKTDQAFVNRSGPGVWVSKIVTSPETFTAWNSYLGDVASNLPVEVAPKFTRIESQKRKRSVTVHFMKRGTHRYPAAGTEPGLKTNDRYDVSYLASPHAHDFWFKVEIGVSHNDRDIEFIQLRLKLEALYEQGTLDVGSKSCEMLAEDLIQQIRTLYGERFIRVSVFEDALHANGGTVEYTPE